MQESAPRAAALAPHPARRARRARHALKDFGPDFRVTRDRAHQIEAKALAQLRHHVGASRLREVLATAPV